MNKLIIWRIKKQFDLLGIHYPIGAMRAWTPGEREEFDKSMCGENLTFHTHWELFQQ